MLLRANVDDLEVVTGSAADIRPHISALQVDNSTPPALQAVPDYGSLPAITTATTTQVIDTSGVTNNHSLRVIEASFHNAHASTSTTVKVQVNDGTRTSIKASVTLLAGETLYYDGFSWLHYDSNGGIYPSVGNSASQAEMEAGTATDKYVTPLGVNWHPGVAKAWAKSIVSAGVPQTTKTWNMTSITDSAVCRVTPVIATDFSSADYAVACTAEAATTTYSATTTALIAIIRNATQTVTQFTIDLLEIDIGQTTDPAAWHWQCFGDQ